MEINIQPSFKVALFKNYLKFIGGDKLENS